jgi:diguanylate cyclase (GGDEF)-like protein
MAAGPAVSLPPFRRADPADSERPLAASPEALTKDWLVRLIEHTPLEQIRDLPTERIVREVPPLIEEILRAVLAPGDGPDISPGSELHRRIQLLASLRDGGELTPELPRDVAALEAVLLRAVKERLGDEPHTLVEAVERLIRLFAVLHSGLVQDLLEARSSELEWLAHTDALTGLFNLRYLRQQIDYLLGLQERYGHPFALLLLDVDGLKRVNDSFGHAAGDELLIGVADAVRAATRSVDVAARIGGDEFCVLAPHQIASRATVLADRLATAIESVETPQGAHVGVSIGVVGCPEHASEAERLLDLADVAMYRAKAAGDRAAVADADAEPGVVEAEDNS